MYLSIKQIPDNLEGKTVLVRCNFDVPIEAGIVKDTTRIEANLETISLLEQKGCRLILLSHQDRPEGHYQEESSFKYIVPLLQSSLSEPINLVPFQEDFHKLEVNQNIRINLIENLRFWPHEEANDLGFFKYLASLGDIFVNEAFANCHRMHSSIVGIPKILKAYAGQNLSHEISILDSVLKNPKKPLVIVIGGAKLDTKEPLVNKFSPIADSILVGGKVAADLSHKSNVLSPNVVLAHLDPSQKDITLESAEHFAQVISSAGTVVLNGTMGVFEDPTYSQGTKIVFNAVNNTSAFTLVGGGDTETALTQFDLEKNIDFISTGGGAMLEYLINGTLPGLEVLQYDAKTTF